MTQVTRATTSGTSSTHFWKGVKAASEKVSDLPSWKARRLAGPRPTSPATPTTEQSGSTSKSAPKKR